ncbi:uncharacterized protein LOC126998964 isoform X2 [Eriocheir sinensis]|nr:uncharacterized protein LOC126998964 isoform X2 [Eriocheir sinensis]XP_050717216.1 uncharacterized protein LOC126998964 isoform X2 [Eriocheir sinensis]
MEESEETIVIIEDEGDDNAENYGSDNEEDSSNEHPINESNDSGEDSSCEEADMSSNEDEVDTFCNSEMCDEPHEDTEVIVTVESTPKGKNDLGDESMQRSSNPTPQSSNARKNYNFKKNKGKGKAGNAGDRYPHSQGKSFNPQSKNNQKANNFKKNNREGFKNVQSPSQHNSLHQKNSKSGDDQNCRNQNNNNPNQNANKSNNFNNSSGGKNNSQGANSSSASKGQNNKSNNKNNNNNLNINNSNNNKKNNNNNNNNNGNNNNSNAKKNSESSYSILTKDILKEVKVVVSKIIHKRVCAQPLDSPILRLHYRLSSLLFVLLYTIIQGCWIWKEAIICVNGFNADAEVPYRIKNYCLSYPFVFEDSFESDERERQRRYILFYRWTHHSFVIIASVFYIPRMLAKSKDNPRLKQLLHDLAEGEHRYDCSTCEQDTKKMVKYMNNHGSTHGCLYLWLIICHVVALGIDCLVVLYFDHMLQGRFMNLVYSAYPLHRDPRFFKDELSLTFPPFVRCMVDEQVYINNKRVEWFGCHLLLMDIYDKMFVVIWLWLVFLIAITIITILALFIWVIPPFNRLFLLMHTDSKHAKKLRYKIVKKFGFTDLYVLHLMKRHRSEAEFIMVMSELVHSEDPCHTLIESKLKQSKVSFKDDVISNGNYFPQLPSRFGEEKWCMDSTQPLSPGFPIEEAIRNRKVDSSTPNPKYDVDASFHRGLKNI